MNWLISRLKEPSTWAAISAMLAGFGLHISDELWQHIAMIGTGVAGVLGVVVAEKLKK
jgi:hypothetical protein